MQSLKEHKLSILFVVIVLVIIVLFFGKNLLNTQQVSKSPEMALEDIKTLITQEKDCAAAMPKLQAMVQKNPTFADAFHWIGVCQFQNKQMVEAKATFEKVLSLNANAEASQNYLNIINSISAEGAEISFSDEKTPTQAEAESAFGMNLDQTKFSLIRTTVLPIEGMQSVAAFYKTTLTTTAAQEYFLSAFKKLSIDMTVQKSGDRTILSSSVTSATKYTVTIEKTSSQVYVTVMSTKPK